MYFLARSTFCRKVSLRHVHRRVFQRLFQQRNQTLNFPGRLLVSFLRRASVQDGIDQNGDGLGDAIKDQQLVGDEEIQDRRAQIVRGRAGHDRLDVMNKFVADKPQRPAAETRQPRHGHRPVAPHDFFHHLQPVLDRLADNEAFQHLAIFEQVHPRAGLLDDGAGVAADERVTANMFAALNRFAQKRLAPAANLAVGRERRLQIRQNAARDRNQVALAGQLQEFRLSRIMHGCCLPSCRLKRHKESEV
jgi:hypothetical protein